MPITTSSLVPIERGAGFECEVNAREQAPNHRRTADYRSREGLPFLVHSVHFICEPCVRWTMPNWLPEVVERDYNK